jgi:hypothetical protein
MQRHYKVNKVLVGIPMMSLMFSILIIHSYPCTDIRVFKREGSTDFKLDGDGGWVLCRKDDGTWRRMCWLPYKRRQGGILEHHRDRVVIGAAGGCVTILDVLDV